MKVPELTGTAADGVSGSEGGGCGTEYSPPGDTKQQRMVASSFH